MTTPPGWLPPTNQAGQTAPDGVHPSDLAREITAQWRFAADDGGKLYTYEHGVYRPRGEEFVARRVKEILLAKSRGTSWSSYRAAETAKYIATDCPRLWPEPPTDVINAENGLLNMRTRELLPHTPDHLCIIRIPVTFDPNADCPQWEWFIKEVFPDDSRAIAYELPAWPLTPLCSIQKALLLQGGGNNGKSTYLEAVRRFIGRRNTSSMALQRLEADRFAMAALCGKLANICPDLPGRSLLSTSIFKAIVGGDELQAEYKFRDSFSFRPFSRLVFSANRMPLSPDDSDGFFRKWQVIPFPRQFAADQVIPQEVLLDRLTAPGELSGLLNRCLSARDTLRKQNRFTDSASMQQALADFRAATDPFAVWLEKWTTSDSLGAIPTRDLVQQYRDDCTRHGRPAPSPKAITQMLTTLRPGVTVVQRTVPPVGRIWCYVGISWCSGGSI